MSAEVRNNCAFCGRERSRKDDNHAPACPYWDFFGPRANDFNSDQATRDKVRGEVVAREFMLTSTRLDPDMQDAPDTLDDLDDEAKEFLIMIFADMLNRGVIR